MPDIGNCVECKFWHKYSAPHTDGRCEKLPGIGLCTDHEHGEFSAPPDFGCIYFQVKLTHKKIENPPVVKLV